MHTLYTKHMALKIRSFRERAGLSQQMLADKAGLSRSQLSEIENEKKPANTLRLNAIAAALGLKVNDLFDDGAHDAMANEVIDLMRDMSAEDRSALLRMAAALAKRQ